MGRDAAARRPRGRAVDGLANGGRGRRRRLVLGRTRRSYGAIQRARAARVFRRCRRRARASSVVTIGRELLDSCLISRWPARRAASAFVIRRRVVPSPGTPTRDRREHGRRRGRARRRPGSLRVGFGPFFLRCPVRLKDRAADFCSTAFGFGSLPGCFFGWALWLRVD